MANWLETAMARAFRGAGLGPGMVTEYDSPALDFAWPGLQLGCEVDGCFWHGCPDHHQLPGTNTRKWLRKVLRNRERDMASMRQWMGRGWIVVRFWEHVPPHAAAAKMAEWIRWRQGR